MTKKQLLYQITHNILGYSSLGFFDHDSDPGKWKEFEKNYFSREGELNGEKYSSTLNENLSGAAMLQVLSEIRTRVNILFEKIDKLED